MLADKHKHNFENYILELSKLGYKSIYKVLNGKDYGIPQSRKRLFTISILGENNFIFPEPIGLKNKLYNYIDFREKDNLTQNFINRYNLINQANIESNEFMIYLNSLPKRKGNGSVVMNLYSFNQMNTINLTDNIAPTLTCRGVQNYCIKFLYNNNIYKPSPKMCWKLMGFSENDYLKCETFSKDKELYDRAGNSIIVNVAQSLIRELKKQGYLE